MNDNDFKKQQGSSDPNSTEKEEIRFDEKDFNNPYAKYFSDDKNDEKQGRRGSDNPYSKYYSNDSSSGWQNKSQYENPYSNDFRQDQGTSWGADFKVNEESPTAPMLDEAREKSNFSRIGLGYALFSVISLAASLVIQIIVLSISREFYESTLFLNLVTPLSLYLFALPVLLIVLSKCEARAPEKRKLGAGKFLLFVITAFGFMYIGSIIGNTFMTALSNLVGYDYSNGLESIIDYDNLWLTAIFTVIVAPIGEEFVFRKLIIDRTQKYGAVISIGLSGLMFGLMHANFYQFFYCFALGLLLGYIYYNTGKLYLTVAIHAIVNFVGSVVSALLIPISEKLEAIDPNDTAALMQFIQDNFIEYIGMTAFNCFTLAAMACGIIFPIAFRKKLKLPQGEIAIPRQRISSIVILNGGILAMLIIYALEIGLNLLPI